MVTLKMDFVAIDVETANADMASICQIGVAKYSEGKLIEEWSSLVDPEDYKNVSPRQLIPQLIRLSKKKRPTEDDM